jgi:hypothetical protein
VGKTFPMSLLVKGRMLEDDTATGKLWLPVPFHVT